MKLTPPVIAGIVIALVVAYVVYNEWRKKRIAEEKAKVMAEIAETGGASVSVYNPNNLPTGTLPNGTPIGGVSAISANQNLGGLSFTR